MKRSACADCRLALPHHCFVVRFVQVASHSLDHGAVVDCWAIQVAKQCVSSSVPCHEHLYPWAKNTEQILSKEEEQAASGQHRRRYLHSSLSVSKCYMRPHFFLLNLILGTKNSCWSATRASGWYFMSTEIRSCMEFKQQLQYTKRRNHISSTRIFGWFRSSTDLKLIAVIFILFWDLFILLIFLTESLKMLRGPSRESASQG